MESTALSSIVQHRPDLDTARVRQAVAMTLEAHAGQLRESGAPAASHPLNVASWIARSGADELSVVAAVLHDVVEDTDVTLRDLRRTFGAGVSDIVGLLTKPCPGVPPPIVWLAAAPSWTPLTARSLHIKLADRIDNMLTVAFLPLSRQRKLALETLRLLCPAADQFDPAAARLLRELSGRVL